MFGIHHTLDAVLDASEPQIVRFGARSGNGAHCIGLIAEEVVVVQSSRTHASQVRKHSMNYMYSIVIS